MTHASPSAPARPRSEEGPGPWPFRLALATLLAAVPLLAFGGSVTTLGAGMAVEGWLVAEGHFLLFFPVDEWFRDTATFVEHTHRLFGVLVGLLAIALVATVFLRDRRTVARGLAVASLLAVCAQGALGGFRVLEDAPQLAFLHGAVAQAVFALLAVTATVLSPTWRGSASPPTVAGSTRLLAAAALAGVYAQIFLGAAYRHALRPAPEEGAGGLLALHLLGAFVALFLLLALAASLHGQSGDADRASALARAPRRIVLLLAVQLFLGMTAWVGYRPDATAPFEWAVSVAHVVVGALLLAQTTTTWIWVERLGRNPTATPAIGSAALGEAH